MEDDGGDDDDVDGKTLLLLLAGYLRRRVVTHPVSTLGGVAAAGYVLGWSLPRAVLRMGSAVMVQVVVGELIDELLAGGSLDARDACGSDSVEEDEPPLGERVASPFVA